MGTPQNLVFPVRGLHESVGYDIQPPGTTSKATNVRGFDVLLNRLRGGRRAGLSKFFGSQINGSNAIQTMTKAVKSTASSIVAGVSDSATGYTVGTPTDMGSNWISHQVQEALNSGGGGDDPNNAIGIHASGFALGAAVLSRHYWLLAARLPTTNSVTATFFAAPQATVTNGNNGGDFGGANSSCQCMGPFIRGSVSLLTFIGARLVRDTSDTTVKLQIFIKDVASATHSVLAESATITLNGGAVDQNDMILALSESGNTLTARLQWVGGGASGSNLDQSLSVVTSSGAGNNRAGVGLFGLAGWTLATNKRIVPNIQLQTITLVLPTVRYTVSRGDAGVNDYFIPSGFTVARVTTAGAVSSQVGPYDSNVNPTPLESVFTTTGSFRAGDTSPTVAVHGFFRTSAADGPFDVDYSLKRSMGAGPNEMKCWMRANAGFTDGIEVEIIINNGTATSATTNQKAFNNYLIVQITNGVRVVLTSANLSLNLYASDSIVRVSDTGTAITISIDGHVVVTHSTSVFNTNTQFGLGPDFSDSTTDTGIEIIRWRLRPDANIAVASPTSESTLIVASGGTISRLKNNTALSITNGAGAMSSALHVIQMQPAFNRVFMIDGTVSKYYNFDTDSISDWTATAGTLQQGARLICLYRGRVVISGVVSDPHNWFMSRVGFPFDFDYGSLPANDPIKAVAGNNSEVGLVGDIITALIPFSDDALLFGGDHTIWQMTGDPAAGGSIDLISDKTGIAFGKAWAKDPNGTLYFMGTDGIYVFKLGGKPESMTKGRIDVRFQNVNLDENRIYLEWDYIRDGLMVQIVPINTAAANTSFFWERRNDAWWSDTYPASMGPTVMYAFDGTAASDQEFLMGTRDGYIRKVDDAANDDDGTDIASEVRYAPFIGVDHDTDVLLSNLLPVLAKNSGAVYVDIFHGQSAEECATKTNPRVRKLLSHAGRNGSMRHRVSGYAVQVGLSYTGKSRWAVEGMTADIVGAGRPLREVEPSNGN